MRRNRGASFEDNENECLLLKIFSIYLNLSELESQHYGLFYFIRSSVSLVRYAPLCTTSHFKH